MTRHREEGAHRNLIGLKVSDDQMALVEALRGEVPVQDFLRGLIAGAVRRDGSGRVLVRGFPDWERRAREAERKLEQVRAVLD